MESIIKKAIEGGYDSVHTKQKLVPHREEKGTWLLCDLAYEHYILDPLFWQALGKACGWEEDNNERGYMVKKGWKHTALTFHDLSLTEGWDKAVVYLEDLSTKSEEK